MAQPLNPLLPTTTHWICNSILAPELYLKRLVVGGFEKVFEINRNCRNEGISTKHNPEFTMLEFYEAFRDYQYLMNLTETMLKELTETCVGSAQITYQGRIKYMFATVLYVT